MTWRDSAACIEVGVDMFFPETEDETREVYDQSREEGVTVRNLEHRIARARAVLAQEAS